MNKKGVLYQWFPPSLLSPLSFSFIFVPYHKYNKIYFNGKDVTYTIFKHFLTYVNVLCAKMIGHIIYYERGIQPPFNLHPQAISSFQWCFSFLLECQCSSNVCFYPTFLWNCLKFSETLFDKIKLQIWNQHALVSSKKKVPTASISMTYKSI